MIEYICLKCNKTFNKKSNYNYHVYKRKTSCVRNYKELNHKIDQIESKLNHKMITKFDCQRCNKSYSSNSNLSRHIKGYCKATINNNLMIIKNELSLQGSTTSINNSLSREGSVKTSSLNEESKNNTKIRTNSYNTRTKSYLKKECVYCDKLISKSNYSKHLNRCKVREKIEKEKEQIYKKLIEQMNNQNNKINIIEKQNIQIIKENNKLKTRININDNRKTNINSNNIIQNNIKLVALGEEDLYKLNKKAITVILGKGYQSVQQLVTYTHFNKNNPKYHNVYIPNMRDKYAMAYDGQQWNLTNKKEVVEQLYEDKEFFLEEKFKEFYISLSEPTQRKFNRFLDSINMENKKVIDKIKHEIKLILYNKRKIPLATKEKMENNGIKLLDNNDAKLLKNK